MSEGEMQEVAEGTTGAQQMARASRQGDGAAIASSSWKLSPDDGIITQETVDLAGKVATCFVSGLSAGTKYTLTNQISTTPNGQIDERSVALKVVDR